VAHLSSYSVHMEVPSPGVKQLDCEVDHSCPSNAEVMSEWSCTSTLPVCFHGMDTQLYIYFIFNDTWQYLIL
jgi:hypothetical protein